MIEKTDIRDGYSSCHVYWYPRGERVDTKAQQASILNDPYLLWEKPASHPSFRLGRWFATINDRFGTPGTSDVIACSWQKDTQQPVGVFSISLRPTTDYFHQVRSGDVLLLFQSNTLVQPGEGTWLTMGIVDRAAESRTVAQGGVTTVTHTITGRDLGKLFLETSPVFDPAFAQVGQGLFTESWFLSLDGDKAARSPLESVLDILNLFFNHNSTGSKIVATQYRFPGAEGTFDTKTLSVKNSIGLASYIDYKTHVQAPMFGYAVPDMPGLAQSGNLWTLLDSYANKCVNELFVDVRESSAKHTEIVDYLGRRAALDMDDPQKQVVRRDYVDSQISGQDRPDKTKSSREQSQMSLVFRQRPYDTSAFEKLYTYDLDETEIYTSDLGYAAHDVYNMFRARFAALPTEHQECTDGIRVNVPSIMAYGIRRMDMETRYCFSTEKLALDVYNGTTKPSDAFQSIYDFYVGLAATWYACNERMLAGTIEARHRPEIRCGTRLRFTRTAFNGTPETLYFYIQGVHQRFSVEQGASRTVLTVVRGVPERKNNDKRLETQLFWNRIGRTLDLPPHLNPYLRVSVLPGLGASLTEDTPIDTVVPGV